MIFYNQTQNSQEEVAKMNGVSGNHKYDGLFELIATSRHQPWYRRLTSQEDNQFKFSKEEIKDIRRVVEEQLDSSESWIHINGVSFPKPGNIFRLKEGTRYAFNPPGSYVFLVHTQVQKEAFSDPEFEPAVDIMPLDSEARLTDERWYSARIQDLEAISEKEVKAFLENRQQKSPIEDLLFDGEAVELAEDVTLKGESLTEGGFSNTFPKGLKGIIDNPKFRRGENLDDINFNYQKVKKCRLTVTLMLSGRKAHQLQEDRFLMPLVKQGDRYNVYLPAYQRPFPFYRFQLRRRSFDKGMFDKVVMDNQTREDILSMISSEEDALYQWGVKKAFHKGRGKIFLAFGPPGTGKTMTGEAIAELLGRPLYIADSTNLGYNPDRFEDKLRDIIDKTERWNSVTLIDEAEIILQSRDAGIVDSSISSMRVAAVLRNLEKLEKGILWLTTNRPPDIDDAIDSRIRAKIYFPPLDTVKRRKVWKLTLPDGMPTPDLIDDHLDKLAKFEINGREIRNAIVNAAERSAHEGLGGVPASYLLAATETIYKNQEVLDKAKRANKRSSPFGFATHKE